MKPYPVHLSLLSGILTLLLTACQAANLTPAPVQPPANLLASDYPDLLQEYSGFSTAALTQNYLTRKVKHWLNQNAGPQLVRELQFARLKHPTLMANVLASDYFMYSAVTQDATVTTTRGNDQALDDFLTDLSVSQGEFRVDSSADTILKRQPIASMNDNNDFVLAWVSGAGAKVGIPQDGSGEGIYAQRYSATGAPQGSEFRVNTYTNSSQNNPALAMNNNGDFVLTWNSAGQDGSGWGVYAQRYNAAGVPQGSEIQVNTYTTNAQFAPDIAIDNSGNFVITWASSGADDESGIYVRRFDATGAGVDAQEIRVNSATEYTESNPSIAMDSNGNFVVAWQSVNRLGDGYSDIYARRFSQNGTARDVADVPVNTYTTQAQSFPEIATNALGDFVVTWDSLQPDSSYDIYARRFDDSANSWAQVAETRINAYTMGNQSQPSITQNAQGDYVIAWSGLGPAGGMNNIYARRFDSSDVAQEAQEFSPQAPSESTMLKPGVGMSGNGDFVLVWTPGTKTGGVQVKARRYHSDGSPH
jgi:hypothetical protein